MSRRARGAHGGLVHQVDKRGAASFLTLVSYPGAVKVWNFETLEEERTLQHSTWVRPLALSADGATLAVGRGDGSVRLWDTATWAEKASCDGNDRFLF